MTIIRMEKHNKALIKSYDDGTYDEIINQLIEDVGSNMPILDWVESPLSSIRISEDTVNKLDGFRLSPKESHESVILRLLLMAKSLNSDSD